MIVVITVVVAVTIHAGSEIISVITTTTVTITTAAVIEIVSVNLRSKLPMDNRKSGTIIAIQA